MVEKGLQAIEVENLTMPSATDSGPTHILSPRNIYEKGETVGNKKSSAAGRKSPNERIVSTNPSNRS